MQKLITILTLLLIFNASQAQKFDKVKNALLINQYEVAKSDLDKILQKNPTLVNSPEALFWEAKINNSFSRDSALSKKYPNSYSVMFKNLETLVGTDQGNAFINEKAEKEKELNIADPFIQVYTKNFADGVKLYDENKFKEAADYFANCVKYSDIFYGRGWLDTKLKSDSLSILYTAICHEKDSNFPKAIVYFERLINEKVMVNLESIFNDLLTCLIQTKEKDKFDTYVEKALIESPKNTGLWEQYAREYIAKAYTIDEKVALYDQLLAANKLTEFDVQYYGELFMEGKTEDPSTEKYVLKASEAFQQAFTMNPTNFRAAYNAGISYYAQFGILDGKLDAARKALQALNTQKPAVAAKGVPAKGAVKPGVPVKATPQDSVKAIIADLNTQIFQKVDLAITWLEKSYNALKDKPNMSKGENSIALRSVDYLAMMYQYKSDKLKSKDPKASAEFAEKFNQYDQLHDKYQQ
jgi:hypothetical protein